MYHLCTTAIFWTIYHKRKILDIRLNIKDFSSVGVTGFEPATTRPSGEGLYSRRHPTVRESPSEIAAAAGSRTALSRPPATVANPTPFEAHPRGKAFEFRSPRIEVSKQAQTFALYRVDATKARMRSATAQIRTTLPPERWSIRDSSRHEPEHPSPTTATFMHARWRFFAFNS